MSGGHGVISGGHVFGCCPVMRWLCHVWIRGMCGGWCRIVRQCRGECAVWRGCDVWLLAVGSLGLRVRPRGVVWVVAGGGSWAGVWCAGFPGMVPLGWRGVPELAWCGVVPVLVSCGVQYPWGRRAGASPCHVRDFPVKCVWAGEGNAA